MTQPVLGPEMPGFELRLPLDEDFVAEIIIPDDEPALDPNGQVLLLFHDITPPVTWEGTMIETTPDSGICRQVVFNVDEADVDLVREKKPKLVRLQYVLGEAKLAWDKGRVRNV